MKVEYHPAVEAELLDIRNYYEARSPGLGAQFIDEFERQVLALAATPERWMVVTGDVRRCLMRRCATGRVHDLQHTLRRDEQEI